MEHMAISKYLLLLGPTGFLGRSLINALHSERIEGWDVIIHQSSPLGSPLLFSSLNLSETYQKVSQSTILADNLNSDLVVINCASSRNSKSNELSRQGNFEFPKRVLRGLLDNRDLKIYWLQIESFWQYSKILTPDTEYVFWKNQFKRILEEASFNNNLQVSSLTLPHLVGPFDNPNRFFPKTFAKMLKNEKLLVDSPQDLFSLADVRDVAEYLAETLNNIIENKVPKSHLFPFFKLTLQEVLNRFLTISNSSSEIEIIEHPNKSNPSMIINDQPPLLLSEKHLLRNLDTTFTDIFQWLSEHDKIGNLE